MNVYDFDDTIFTPDSSLCFLLYCLRHYPRAVLTILPSSALQFAVYRFGGKKDAKKLKEALFSFLKRIDNAAQIAEYFWDRHFERVESWYLDQKRSDDLIISASPEFLLKPAAERLGVELIATPMNPYTGKIHGKNCHDREKLRRFRERFPNGKVDEFYSDSLSDEPMAEIAEKAFLVRKGERFPWPRKSENE